GEGGGEGRGGGGAGRGGGAPASRGRTGREGRPLHPGRARAAVRARHLAPARLRPRQPRGTRRHVRHAGAAAPGVAGGPRYRRHEGKTGLMTGPAWLLVAAAVLALMAGWCANAEAALALVSATGAAERAPRNKHHRLALVAA